MKLKTVLYSNPISSFGLIFLKNFLQNDQLEIDEIVFSTIDLAWRFHLKLKGEAYFPPSKKAEKKYTQNILKIKKWIAQYSPKTQIRFISNANSKEESQFIKKYKVVFCGAFPQIFKPIFFQATEWGAVNFHPSYLPRCRGAHPIYWTIANQEDYAGISSHFITKKIDQGTIINRLKIAIDSTQINYKKLFDLVDSNLHSAINACVENLNKDVFVTDISEQASFNNNEKDEDRTILWSDDTIEKISLRIRSGGAFSYLRKAEKIHFTPPVFLYNNAQSGRPSGTILKISKKGILFQARDGQILCDISYSYSFFGKIILFFIKFYTPLQRIILSLLWRLKFMKNSYLKTLT